LTPATATTCDLGAFSAHSALGFVNVCVLDPEAIPDPSTLSGGLSFTKPFIF